MSMWSPIETAAVLLGLACVWLTVRQHIGCWPTGLAMVTLYIYIFYHAKLYSDMLLQVVYVFLQLYGWHAWLHGGPQRSTLPVSELPLAHAMPSPPWPA
jgi:nicotinamide mononucleotide transporter